MPTSSEIGRVHVEDVGKRFVLLKDERRLLGLSQHRFRAHEYLWALRHLYFDLEPGQSIGVIGPNGSGKSTLLRVLAGVTAQTEGTVELTGRVSSLITIGAGFKNELTGRENLFVGGAVLGMREAEVQRAADDIIDFSGLAAAIDRPVKHYSSGMYMRLGFSLAIFAQPDVLLVDEVLSVGDRAFRAKCDERMKAMLADGVTLVFVSHAMPIIHSLCPRSLVLSKGEVVFDGPSDEAIARYHSLINTAEVEAAETEFETDAGVQRVIGGAEVVQAELLDAKGVAQPRFAVGDDATLRCIIKTDRPIERFRARMAMSLGNTVIYTMPLGKQEETVEAGETVEVRAALTLNVGPGTYTYQITARSANENGLAARHRSAPFYVTPRDDLSGWGIANLEGREEPIRVNGRKPRSRAKAKQAPARAKPTRAKAAPAKSAR